MEIEIKHWVDENGVVHKIIALPENHFPYYIKFVKRTITKDKIVTAPVHTLEELPFQDLMYYKNMLEDITRRLNEKDR